MQLNTKHLIKDTFVNSNDISVDDTIIILHHC